MASKLWLRFFEFIANNGCFEASRVLPPFLKVISLGSLNIGIVGIVIKAISVCERSDLEAAVALEQLFATSTGRGKRIVAPLVLFSFAEKMLILSLETGFFKPITAHVFSGGVVILKRHT